MPTLSIHKSNDYPRHKCAFGFSFDFHVVVFSLTLSFRSFFGRNFLFGMNAKRVHGWFAACVRVSGKRGDIDVSEPMLNGWTTSQIHDETNVNLPVDCFMSLAFVRFVLFWRQSNGWWNAPNLVGIFVAWWKCRRTLDGIAEFCREIAVVPVG